MRGNAIERGRRRDLLRPPKNFPKTTGEGTVFYSLSFCHFVCGEGSSSSATIYAPTSPPTPPHSLTHSSTLATTPIRHSREGGGKERRRKTTGSSILLLTDFPSFRQGSLSSTNVSSSSSGGRGAGGRHTVRTRSLLFLSPPPPSLSTDTLSPSLPYLQTRARKKGGAAHTRRDGERGRDPSPFRPPLPPSCRVFVCQVGGSEQSEGTCFYTRQI